jgi:hypothetical protein
MITKELLLNHFEYKDGDLYWKLPFYKRNDLIGKKAGTCTDKKTNRFSVTIYAKHYKLHRLIFLMFHGYMPKEVDHIDGNSLNNKIENLREANRSENNCNVGLKKTNTSGYKGVHWDKNRKKWMVTVIKNNVVVFNKRFDDLELAGLAAQEARNKFHNSFARHQ